MIDLIKYRSRRDRVILWAGLVVLAGFDLFTERPTGVYLCDPISGTILASILITGALTAGSYALNYYIAKKRKVPNVDRGRMDDIRLQANGYQEHIVRGYGKFRVAGFLLDATSITHTTQTTEGRPGGKGAPKPPEPGTVNHVYTTSLDIGVCESLGALSPDLKVTRIWENIETIYDTTVSTQGDAFYEAERPGNTLAGGATTSADASASGDTVVTLPTNGSVQFNGLYGNGTAVVEFYYKTSAANTVEITPSPLAMFPETLHNTGGEWHVYRTAPFTMTSGFVNTLKIKNTHASTMYVDNACVRISGQGTGIINPFTVRSEADDLDPIARYGFLPDPDADGTTTAQVVAGGNANIRIYNGSETQDPDSAFVAIHGAGNVPAYRGLCHVVFDNYVLKEPAVPNFSFEVDTGVYDIDDIVPDLYALVNVGSAKVDVTALAGLALETDEGFLITSREEAGRWLNDLITAYQFDMPEVDGKVKAVLRNGASAGTVAADELRSHWEDEEAPERELDIADVDPLALPSELAVGYMDALLDYHTNTQTATVGSGVYGDKQTVNLSMILTADHARRIASAILWQRHMESRTFRMKLGPKFQKYHPGDVLTVNTTNATHTVRIGEHLWQLMGVQDFQGVRHAASVYTQTLPGTTGSGYEAPVILYPGNAKLVLMDLPILRPEDAGDGTQPVVYLAVCLQGEGVFRGAFHYKEKPKDSGSYQFECPVDIEASVGVVASGTAGTIDRTVWDRSTSLVFDFFPATTLSSATEVDVADNPELNLLAIGSGTTWYVCQFTTASAGSASSPYNSRYTVSGFLWDRFGSGAPPAGDLTGLQVVVLNSAVKPRQTPLEDIGVARNYKCATAGQSLDDAETVSFTLAANSLKPLAPVNLRGSRNTAGDLLVEWTRRERIASGLRDNVGTPRNEESEVYVVEIYSGATLKRTVRNPTVLAAAAVQWQGVNNAADLTISADGTIEHPGTVEATARSAQTWAGDFTLEFEYPSGTDMPLQVGVFDASAALGALSYYTTTNGAAYFEFGGGQVRPNGKAAYSLTPAAGDRLSIVRAGDIVRFYHNAHLTTTPVPFYETTFRYSGKLMVVAHFSAPGGEEAVKVRINYPIHHAYSYTAGAQVENFGSAQSSVKVRVYQESAIVGRGHYAEATL